MKWLKKLRLLKRLREQENRLEHLKSELEEANAPEFSALVTNANGAIESIPIPVCGAQCPSFPQMPLSTKLKLATDLIEEGVGLEDLMLVLETNKGVFQKMLCNTGSKDIKYDGDTLVARADWPTIEVGKDVKIFSAWLTMHGYLMDEVRPYRNYQVEQGDSLKVGFTFRAP